MASDRGEPGRTVWSADTVIEVLYRLGLVLCFGAFAVFTVYVAEYTTWGQTIPEKFGVDGVLGPNPEHVAVGLFVLGAVSFCASLAMTLAAAEEG